MSYSDEETKLLHKIQDAEFEMLMYVDKLCRNSGIKYYLWGGSLLGAIRHHDFIPWDDDLDIVLFRDDYEKLKEEIVKNPNDKFHLYIPDEDEYFNAFIPMLYYRNSKLKKECDDGLTNEIHLDIFILDKTSNSKIGRKIHGSKMLFVYGLALAHRKNSEFSKRFDTSLFQKISAKSLRLLGRLFSLETIRKKHIKCAIKYNKKSTNYMFCTNNAPTCLGEKHSHSASVYEETILIDFHGTKIPIPSGYDVIMKSGYGNYMELPPENKRECAHANLKEAEVDGYSINSFV